MGPSGGLARRRRPDRGSWAERLQAATYAARRWLGLQGPPAVTLWSADARSLLRKPGCPVCRSIGEWLDRQAFWFLEEQYHHASTVAEMADSHGFCRAHAAQYLETGAGYRLGYLHLLMVQDALRRLRRLHRALAAGRKDGGAAASRAASAARGLARRGPCLVCHDILETERRTAHGLVYALRDPEILGAVEAYGKLCSLHFPMVAELASAELLRLLLQVQAKGLAGARRADQEPPAGAGLPGPLPAGLPLPWRALARSAGADVKHALRMAEAAALRNGTADGPLPAGPRPDRLGGLLAEDRCPVCTLAQEAVAAYLAWYRETAGEGMAHPGRHGDGLRRLCRDHLWQLARGAGQGLLLDLAACMLGEDRARLERAEAILTAPDPPPPWRSGVAPRAWPRSTAVWLRRMCGREMRRLAGARRALAHLPECPACRQQATITQRTLALLFALLEDGAVRDRYCGAWGLCMQHFADGLGVAAEPPVLELVVEVQIARLATLAWELEEYFRKSAWDARHEPHGPEDTAWIRAIERFSGTDLLPATARDRRSAGASAPPGPARRGGGTDAGAC